MKSAPAESREFAQIDTDKFHKLLQEIRHSTPRNVPVEINELLLRAEELYIVEEQKKRDELIGISSSIFLLILASLGVAIRFPEFTDTLVVIPLLYLIIVMGILVGRSTITKPQRESLEIGLAAYGCTDDPSIPLSEYDTSEAAHTLLKASSHFKRQFAPRPPRNPWRVRREQEQAKNNYDHLLTARELRSTRRERAIREFPQKPITR
jgi:hypothetical protein